MIQLYTWNARAGDQGVTHGPTFKSHAGLMGGPW